MPQVAQGGTVRLYTTYRDGSGGLTDPTTPLVDILDPGGTPVVTDAVPVRDSLGTFHYDFAADIASPISDAWTARWTGVISSALLEGEENFEVVAPGSVTPVDPTTLVSVAEYEDYTDQELAPDEEAQVDILLQAASRAVADEAARDFLASPVTEVRTFEYDGSGILEFADASDITQVAVADGATLDPKTYVLHTQNGLYTWIELPATAGGRAISPEMGFTYNLDRLAARLPAQPTSIEISATFGWADIPATIKLAVVWTVQDWLARPDDDMTGESIASFSRQWAQSPTGAGPALPGRVKDLIATYRRDPYALG